MAPSDAEPTPLPVDVAPAAAAVRRSWVRPTEVPASTSGTRRVGVPSASYATPAAGASSTSDERRVELGVAERARTSAARRRPWR